MEITALPDSVRLDPVGVRLFENQPGLYKNTLPADYLFRNPVWDSKSKKVTLKAARNETVAFQLVLIFDRPHANVSVSMTPLRGKENLSPANVELFKEWFVEVKTPSSGYERTTLGKGWYPDALVPFDAKQRYFGNPFSLPDYWNRIDGQRAAVIWADLFVPKEQPAGNYQGDIVIQSEVTGETRVAVELTVWPFTLPDENSLKGNLYTGHFKHLDDGQELQYQHLFKKHRICHHQVYYRPDLTIADGKPKLDWTAFDARLSKYFDGSAFTENYGYRGPGTGEPMEHFILPFNCSGKKGAVGWPLPTDGEKDESFWRVWDQTAEAVARHLIHEKRIGPKTQVQIFLNALDECYDRKDHERMVMWSTALKKHFPKALFRIDGGYDDPTMEFLSPHVDLCIYHTAAYDLPIVEKFRKKGVRDWIYGPMVYESRTNELCGSSTFIDLNLLTMRGLGWTCFKYGAESWCQWEFAYGSKRAWHNPENFKNSDLKEFRCYNGSGMMLYDGETMDLPAPVASIRFKATRSGAQEYEYLKLFEKLGGDAQAIADRLVYSPLGEQSIGNLEPWNMNIGAWDEMRISLGEEIARLSPRT